MTARVAFRQSDVQRAIGGAIKAGLQPGEFEVRADPLGVRIITFAQKVKAPSVDPNPWDSVFDDGED